MTGAARDSQPRAPRRESVRDLHGVRDGNDYAWMRDAADPEMLAYLRAERAYYDAVTARLQGRREDLLTRMIARVPDVEESPPWHDGGYEYRTRIEAGRQYEALLRARPGEQPRVVLDLEAEAAGHDYAEVGVREVSPDGRWLAWSMDTTGEEVYALRFRDLSTGADAAEVVPRTYYTGAWSADSRHFFYTVHDEIYRPYAVVRHRLGTPVADDVEVFRDDDQAYEVTVRSTRSGGLIVIRTANRDTAECHLVPAADPTAEPAVVWRRERGVEYDIDHLAADPLAPADARGTVLAVTDDEAPEFRVLAYDVGGVLGQFPPALMWREVVGGREDVRVLGVEPFATFLVLPVRHGGRAAIEIRDVDGGLARTVAEIDPEGTVRLARNEEYRAETLIVESTSLVRPRSWWSVDSRWGEPSLLHRQPMQGYEEADYVTRRIGATAKDGVPVPVTIAHRTGVQPDGTHPCLLLGYGAYESCHDPEFDVGVSVLLDLGVVVAIAHIRGGGENGRAWWQAGRLRAKPTTFGDFVAAGHALVDAGWARSGALAARGISAGGLLIGAAIGLDPALWRAVVAEVPFVDVVGSMLDPGIPLTVAEWDEWGNPRVPSDFAVMRAYSPYDNPPPGPRPDLLVTGALHDPRVLVHEPAAWVARLRATSTGGEELLFRPELGEGAHTGPAGRLAHLAYEAEILAWLLDRLAAPAP